jgi:trimeric autotransporter adhesin
LGRIDEMRVLTWSYKAEEETTRHMGPTAQDFRHAFNLGDSETSISTVDVDGVALAAIQALYQLNQEQATRIASLEKENATLRQQNASIESRVAALEQSAQPNHEGTHSDHDLTLATLVTSIFLGMIVVQRPWQRGQQ